jgi:hypothetical protein
MINKVIYTSDLHEINDYSKKAIIQVQFQTASQFMMAN